jgi:hypothetical protein
LSVLLFTASEYLFGIFKLLFVLLPFFFFIVLSVLLFTTSDYLFGIFKPLCPFDLFILSFKDRQYNEKEKEQKDKEKLEDTKEVFRSSK